MISRRRFWRAIFAFALLVILIVISYFAWAVHYDNRRNLRDVPATAETGSLPSFYQNKTCIWCIWQSSINFASNEGETSLRYTLSPNQPKAVTDFAVNASRTRYLHVTVSEVSNTCGPGASVIYGIYVAPGLDGRRVGQVSDTSYALIGKPRDLMIDVALTGQTQPGCRIVVAFEEPYLHSLPAWLPVGKNNREVSVRDRIIGACMLVVCIGAAVILERR